MLALNRKLSRIDGLKTHQVHLAHRQNLDNLWAVLSRGNKREREIVSVLQPPTETEVVTFGFVEDAKKTCWVKAYVNKRCSIQNHLKYRHNRKDDNFRVAETTTKVNKRTKTMKIRIITRLIFTYLVESTSFTLEGFLLRLCEKLLILNQFALDNRD